MDFHLIINITECQIKIVSELIWHLYLFNKLAAHRCTMDQLEKVTAYKYIYSINTTVSMAILLGGGGEGGGGKVAASCHAAFLLSSTVLGFLYKKKQFISQGCRNKL